jgi:aminoglycoside phosphotransferase (APT) family kinase protein
MKTFKHIITALTLIALLTPVVYSQESKTSLGMFFKVINNVEKKSVEKDWHNAD